MTTTDHKKIGILYLVNSLLFFFAGGILAMVVRVELAQPGLQVLSEDFYNQAFTIHFDNKEAQPHNVAIKDANGAEVFKGAIFQGPAAQDYQVPALPPGTYQFVCSVHPNMTGTLTAQ